MVIGLRERGLKTGAINSYIRGINVYLRWLHENGHGELLVIKKLKEEQSVLRSLTDAELKAIVSFKPQTNTEKRLKAILLTLVDTGMRINEALSLERSRVNFDDLLLTVKGKGNKAIWNWLSLLAFIFFPLSALNSFFSLRSRYKDWRAVQTKKGFEKRLQQLAYRIDEIGEYRENPTLFYSLIAEQAAQITLSFFGSFSLVVWSFILSPTPDTQMRAVMFCGQIILLNAVRLLWKLIEKISYVRNPFRLGREAKVFMAQGEHKGFLTKKHQKAIYERLFKYKMMSKLEEKAIRDLSDLFNEEISPTQSLP